MDKDFNKEIERFIQAIEESYIGLNPKTSWPLNGGQMDAYFSVDESLDMYKKLNMLKKKMDITKIADLMPPADVIRIFLQHNAIIGLKDAKTFGVNVDTCERIKFTLFLFDILKHKVKNDIFCLDGKNIILDEKKIKAILNREWKQISIDDVAKKEEIKKLASLIVNANNIVYALFYDEYMTGGFYIHGPYNAEEKFGKGCILLIREYHNLNPVELWPEIKMPFNKLKIFCIYNGLDVKINFVNHLITKDSIANKLIAYSIYLDDKEIKDYEKIKEIVEILREKCSEQIKRVNILPDLDKVMKGAEICYYLFKDLRINIDENWKPGEVVNIKIKKFGDKFIKEYKYEKIPLIEHWKKIFDPRDDYC